MEYNVEIVNKETGEIVKVIGPESLPNAEQVERGISINLAHDRYWLRIVAVEETHS